MHKKKKTIKKSFAAKKDYSIETKKFLSWLCGGIIIPLILIPLFFQLYIIPKQKNQLESRESRLHLNKLIRELFFRDEDTYKVCMEQGQIATTTDHRKQIKDINKKRNQALEELVNFTIDIHDRKIIDDTAYQLIKRFTQWNNILYFSEKDICHLKLKNPIELEQWRNNLSGDARTLSS